jgi:hypothetical protein
MSNNQLVYFTIQKTYIVKVCNFSILASANR